MASTLGIVGAAAGLVGFAVATLPKLDQFRRDFIGTNFRKDWYQSQLDSVQTKLENWGNLWCGPSVFSRQDYEHFWGASGYDSVRTKIRLIEAELIAIGRLLERKVDWELDAEMRTKWRKTRYQLGTEEATRMVESHANLIQRFTFAMFRGTELEERVKRLQEKVKDLESFSQEKFANIQLSLPSGENLEATTLSRLLTRKKWMEDQERIFKCLYGLSTKNTDAGWSLVLAIPDEDMSFDDDAGLWTTFDIQRYPGTKSDLGLASFYSTSLRDAILWYQSLARKRSPRHPPKRDPYLSSRFAEPRRRDDGLRVALAEAAIGLVDWTMLLWRTPWTDGICTCGIRLVTATISDGSTEMAVTFQNKRPCDKNEFRHDETIQSRKALLVGISLAEFALTQHIGIQLQEDGVPLFSTGNGWRLETELLDQVATTAGRAYRDAVGYCFRYDHDLENNRQFRPHHFLLFRENVVKKLDQHLKGVYKRMSLVNRRNI